ncbi:hypothetical protein AHAT_12610 [Agarivorans sp. Toyoura001]|nr:hypothetical protein AHAT_12610 [Agarivorans sp. Toyoura001]
MSLMHSMEMEHEAHEHHQCEMYEAINNAVNAAATLEYRSDKAQCYQTFEPQAIAFISKELPRTRSPPSVT